jgi:hypothetical protein
MNDHWHIIMIAGRAFVRCHFVRYIFRGDSEMVDYNNLHMLIYTPIRSSANPNR